MGNHTPLQAGNAIEMVNYREKIQTIKDTVAKGANDSQLEMFLTICNQYQLDPFLKEIYFVPGVGVMTGRDGYLKVAMRDANYDGIVSAAVCEGDEFEINPVLPEVKHKFGAKRGEVIGAYALVFHKQRRPAVCFAPFSEYRKSSSIWQTYKSAMICKVAEVLALKRQFGINGLVTEEEIGLQSAAEEGQRESYADVSARRIAETKQPEFIEEQQQGLLPSRDSFRLKLFDHKETPDSKLNNILKNVVDTLTACRGALANVLVSSAITKAGGTTWKDLGSDQRRDVILSLFDECSMPTEEPAQPEPTDIELQTEELVGKMSSIKETVGVFDDLKRQLYRAYMESGEAASADDGEMRREKFYRGVLETVGVKSSNEFRSVESKKKAQEAVLAILTELHRLKTAPTMADVPA
ncbi:MAG: hypothetical protein NVSMB58_35410 [Terriglobales bacterium]